MYPVPAFARLMPSSARSSIPTGMNVGATLRMLHDGRAGDDHRQKEHRRRQSDRSPRAANLARHVAKGKADEAEQIAPAVAVEQVVRGADEAAEIEQLLGRLVACGGLEPGEIARQRAILGDEIADALFAERLGGPAVAPRPPPRRRPANAASSSTRSRIARGPRRFRCGSTRRRRGPAAPLRTAESSARPPAIHRPAERRGPPARLSVPSTHGGGPDRCPSAARTSVPTAGTLPRPASRWARLPRSRAAVVSGSAPRPGVPGRRWCRRRCRRVACPTWTSRRR